MMTSLQRDKMSHLFKILDFDHNGYIQESDLTGVSENICIIKGILEGSFKENALKTATRQIWNSFQKHFNNPNLQTCTLEQWLEFMAHYLVNRDEEVVKFFSQRMAENLFHVFDQNLDQKLSKIEYMCIFMSFRVDIKKAHECFDLLDLNSDGFISSEEFIRAIFEFIKSDEEDSPGNSLFGDIKNYYFSTRKVSF